MSAALNMGKSLDVKIFGNHLMSNQILWYNRKVQYTYPPSNDQFLICIQSFCGTGCQNGCDAVQPPSGSGSSAKAKTIGYYESWAYTRDCDAVTPEDIDATIWTHLK